MIDNNIFYRGSEEELVELFRKICSSVKEFIFVFDKKARFVFCKVPRKELLLTNPENFLGKKTSEIMPENVSKKFKKNFKKNKEGRDSSFEYELEDKWFRASLYPIMEKNEFNGSVALIRNITERKKLENQLSKIIENSFELTGLVKTDGTLVRANKTSLDFIGAEEEEVVNKKFWNTPWWTHSEEEQEKLKKSVKKASDGEEVSFKTTHLDKDGEKRFISFKIRPIKDHEINLLVAEGHDITEQRKLEYELRERIKELRMIYYDSKILRKNSDIDEILETIVKKLPTAYQYPDITCARIECDDEVYESKSFWASRWNQSAEIKVDGEKRGVIKVYYKEKKDFLKEEKRMLDEVASQISSFISRKKFVNKLEESKKRFEKSISNAPFPVMIHAEDGEVVLINNVWEEITGYSVEEIPTIEEWVEKAYGEKKSLVKKDIEELFKKNKREVEGEYKLRTKEGEERIWSFSSSPLGKMPDGRRLFISMAHDITERKKAEQKLRESREKYKGLFNSTITGITVHDSNGLITAANSVAEEIFGLSEEELKKKKVGFWKNKLYDEEENPLKLSEFPISRVAETKESYEGIVIGLRMSKDEDIRWFLHSARPLLDDKGDLIGVVTSFVDITERKKFSEAIEEINDCFLSLTDDSLKNINKLVNTAGEIVGGACALYNRLESDELLCTYSIWHEPKDYNPEDNPEGHLCYDVIRKNKRIMINDLTGTKYEETDPNVKKYDFKSYLGIPVKIGDETVGSFCVCDVKKREFSEYEVKIMSMLAQAVSIEEERLLARKELEKSEEKYHTLIENTGTAIVVLEEDTTISYANQFFEQLSGYSKEEVENKKSWTEFVTKEYLEKMEEYHEKRREKDKEAPNKYEFDFVNKKGDIRRILLFIDTIPGTKKRVASLIDITELKKIEEELRESREKYKLITDNTSDLIAIVDFKGNYIYANPAHERLLGYSSDELIGKSVFKLMHPEDKKRIKSIVLKYAKKFVGRKLSQILKTRKKLREEKGSVTATYRLKDKDGNWHYLETKGNSIKLENKGFNIITASRDITERKKAEEELKKSEELYSTLFNQSHDAVMLLDLKGHIKKVNQKYLKFFKREKDEVIGKRFDEFDVEYGLSAQEIFKRIKEIIKKKELQMDMSFYDESVGKKYLSVSSKLVKLPEGRFIQAIIRDITERKKAEESKAFVNEMIINISKMDDTDEICDYLADKIHELNKDLIIGISYYDKDKQGIIIESVKGLGKIGDKVVNIVGRLKQKIIHTEDMSEEEKKIYTSGKLEEVKGGIHTLMTGGVSKKLCKKVEDVLNIGSVYTVGFGRESPKGGITLFVKKGKELEYTNVVETIASYAGTRIYRIQAEEELSRNEEELRAMFESSSDGILVLDMEGNIVKLNEQVVEGTMFSEEELLGKNFTIFSKMLVNKDEEFLKNIFKSFFSGEKNIFELKIKTEEGERIIEISPSFFTIKGEKKGIIVLMRDITERVKAKRLEEETKAQKELRELRKEFLMSLTHELKQPLTPIMGYAGLLKEQISDDEQVDYLKRIISNSHKMKELINKVLNLMKLEAGALKFHFEEVNLSNLILDAITAIESKIELKNINIVKDLHNLKIKADYERLKEVFVNLIDNAVKFSDKEDEVEVRMKELDGKVQVIVKDYGIGIKEGDIPKLFKKFSQTDEGKRKGGFGIGLAMGKHVVEEHDGKISVESEYGKWTKFTVVLPKL